MKTERNKIHSQHPDGACVKSIFMSVIKQTTKRFIDAEMRKRSGDERMGFGVATVEDRPCGKGFRVKPWNMATSGRLVLPQLAENKVPPKCYTPCQFDEKVN